MKNLIALFCFGCAGLCAFAAYSQRSMKPLLCSLGFIVVGLAFLNGNNGDGGPLDKFQSL